ncbi:MAG TPA: diguanylate cyclase [Rhodobacteraceae bacterium]|nr:diguanylate cyclase [Paracoccaceae bacterium]
MTSEIKQAFSHPELRSLASCGSDFPDRISVRGHVEEVEIGAFQAERGNTQRLQFDLVVEVGPPSGPLDDDVDRILSYDTLTQAIGAELQAGRLNLLETLAERIADRILREPQALRVFVRIEKLDRGTGALGVEIVRGRDAGSKERSKDVQAGPLVVFLQNVAISGGNIGQWIARFEQHAAPVIFCADLPKNNRQQAADALSQRRIDLLEIEQNAWMLASQFPKLVVVDSRTELDWGVKQGQLSLWAPSKIILDAVDGPNGVVDGLKLAIWLSEVLNAERLVVIGNPENHAQFQAFDHSKPESFK